MQSKLELKHLSVYLPYGLKVIGFNSYIDKDMVCELTDRNLWTHIENQSKPLLRHLYSLTEEIDHNGERFVPIIQLFKLRTQVTGDKIADYYIENDTAILRLEAQHLDEYEFRVFFEIDLEPNGVMFSIATETWKDEVMIREDVNMCGNEMTMFEKLHEWHFDTANLLGRGLALPIDGKEVEGE